MVQVSDLTVFQFFFGSGYWIYTIIILFMNILLSTWTDSYTYLIQRVHESKAARFLLEMCHGEAYDQRRCKKEKARTMYDQSMPQFGPNIGVPRPSHCQPLSLFWSCRKGLSSKRASKVQSWA